VRFVSHVRKRNRLKVYENRVLRKIYECPWKKVTDG